jgi:aminomethyltransferase
MTQHLSLEARHRECAGAFSTVWDHEIPSSFAKEAGEEYAAVRDAVGLFDQSYRGVLDLVGDAVEGFLQRLVSTQAAGTSETLGQDSALLSAKGRLLAAFQLHRIDDARFRMILGEPLRESVVSALAKYAFLDDIELVDRSEDVAVLAVAGPSSAEAVMGLMNDVGADAVHLPGERLERVAASLANVDVEVIRASETNAGGFEIWVPRAHVETVWVAFLGRVESLGGSAVGWRAAESLRVEAGLTRHEIDYDDDCFPTEVNHGHRLSYDKCYVGQEVAARMRTYGHVNRRLFLLSVKGESALNAGEKIVSGDDDAGRVTSVCEVFRENAPRGIGMVKRKYWESSELRTESGAQIFLSNLPEQEGHGL